MNEETNETQVERGHLFLSDSGRVKWLKASKFLSILGDRSSEILAIGADRPTLRAGCGEPVALTLNLTVSAGQQPA